MDCDRLINRIEALSIFSREDGREFAKASVEIFDATKNGVRDWEKTSEAFSKLSNLATRHGHQLCCETKSLETKIILRVETKHDTFKVNIDNDGSVIVQPLVTTDPMRR